MSGKKSNKYHDKMPWPKTLVLTGVYLLLGFCVISAYNKYSQKTNTNNPINSSITATNLLKVNNNTAKNTGKIIDYEYFTVNFNPKLHIPNWVGWELTRQEISGNEKRGSFQTDESVKGCAQSSDYTKSGYDRGHMVPAADMKWNPTAMDRCFYMTNICPQAHTLNGGAWKKLEEKCRIWADADSSIVIICGPILNPDPDEFIGDSKVAVPKSFFKVIYSPNAKPPRGIGFIMPNGKVPGGLQNAAVTIDEVEAQTGFDFFYELPDDVENQIESECRFHFWSTIKPRK